MSTELEHISVILKRLTEELKLDNDKWEREQNGRPILPTSDAGIARNSDQTTGENK
jgi:hypothetical protein